MTPLRLSIFAAIAALILLAVVFELMRSRRLQERYALLWILTGIVVFVLAVWRGLLGWAADLVGISYPPSALLRAGLVLHPRRAAPLLDGDLEALRGRTPRWRSASRFSRTAWKSGKP
jgi:hypothetical protein